jgi:hypothetical protein
MRTMHLNRSLRFLSVVALIAAIAGVQFLYDAVNVTVPPAGGAGLSPEIVRMLDMGFNSTAGSFLWVATMPDILDLFRDRTEYLPEVAYLNQVDPKLSYPYAFSVITLPIVPTSTGYTTGLQDAQAIGLRGIANANPDWRIPYYMAFNYYLELNDIKDAAIYFDKAAQTPGAPYYAIRFSENFGAQQDQRLQTIELWTTIRDSTNDPDTKARAQAYIDHLELWDYLQTAADQFQKLYGVEPTALSELVTKNIILSIPEDPFGYQFIIASGTVEINFAATSTLASTQNIQDTSNQ